LRSSTDPCSLAKAQNSSAKSEDLSMPVSAASLPTTAMITATPWLKKWPPMTSKTLNLFRVTKKAAKVVTLMPLLDRLEDYDVVGVDEGQFFEDVVEFC